jgi:hypothetical protein
VVSFDDVEFADAGQLLKSLKEHKKEKGLPASTYSIRTVWARSTLSADVLVQAVTDDCREYNLMGQEEELNDADRSRVLSGQLPAIMQRTINQLPRGKIEKNRKKWKCYDFTPESLPPLANSSTEPDIVVVPVYSGLLQKLVAIACYNVLSTKAVFGRLKLLEYTSVLQEGTTASSGNAGAPNIHEICAGFVPHKPNQLGTSTFFKSTAGTYADRGLTIQINPPPKKRKASSSSSKNVPPLEKYRNPKLTVRYRSLPSGKPTKGFTVGGCLLRKTLDLTIPLKNIGQLGLHGRHKQPSPVPIDNVEVPSEYSSTSMTCEDDYLFMDFFLTEVRELSSILGYPLWPSNPKTQTRDRKSVV